MFLRKRSSRSEKPKILEIRPGSRYKRETEMQRKALPGYFTIPRLENIPFLVHGFGTKHWTEKDFNRDDRLRTFRRISLRQIHSDSIQFVEQFPDKQLEGDALVTEVPGFLLMVKTADCLPVLIVDEAHRVVAAVHCGWRSTGRGLVQKVIRSLRTRYGCSSAALLVAMGPSIAGGCYEVGEKVLQFFVSEGLSGEFFRPIASHRSRYLLDLKDANRDQLARTGVKRENIFSVDNCTHCDENLLSFRRDRNETDRMLSFIGIS
jgi:YfiH family protein